MNKKTILAFAIIVLVLSVSALLLFKDGTFGMAVHPRLNGTMELVVIPYFSPTDSQWQAIYDEAQEYPGTIKYVVINPCSGPCGAALSSDWAQVISSLRERGINTLGYVYNTNESLGNIDYYMKGTGVHTDGIFFDNEGSENDVGSFQQYAAYVHHLGGIVYINPGYNYSYVSNYLLSGESDVANMYELGYGDSHKISENKAFSPWKTSVILGNVTNPEELRSGLSELASKGIGISYLYGDSYGRLPKFFSSEVEEAAGTFVRDGK